MNIEEENSPLLTNFLFTYAYLRIDNYYPGIHD